MENRSDQSSPHRDFELRFNSLLKPGRGFVFPCDVDGLVATDELSEVLRDNYFFARAAVGAELACPVVAMSQHRLQCAGLTG